MKTLAGWILGVFALGLVLGDLYRGVGAEAPKAGALADLPAVDCGPDREALFEPVESNGTTTLRVRCVARELPPWTSTAAPMPVQAPTTRPVYVTAPSPTPVVIPAPPSVPVVTTHARASVPVATDANVKRESRSWERSAIIIGSSAGAGAGIGALAKGGKGALVGAAIGGVAGTVYDLSTRNKKD